MSEDVLERKIFACTDNRLNELVHRHNRLVTRFFRLFGFCFVLFFFL